MERRYGEPEISREGEIHVGHAVPVLTYTDKTTYYATSSSSSSSSGEDEPMAPPRIRRESGFHNTSRTIYSEPEIPPTDYSDYEEVETTQIYVYKGIHPTWRVGPDRNDPKCWLYSEYSGDINGFDNGQERCKSGMKWYEYRNGEWHRIWQFRMKDSGKEKDVEGMCHTGAVSEWNQRHIHGFYKRKKEEKIGGAYYYHRESSGRRITAYPPGEKPKPQPVYSDVVAVYIYKLNNKWRLSPDFDQEKAWLFTKNSTLNDDTTWYTFGTERRGHKVKKVRIPTAFKVRDLRDRDGRQIYNEVLYGDEEAGAKDEGTPMKLSKSKEENFLGGYRLMKKDVYVHGPIAYDGSRRLVLKDEMLELEMIYVGENSFDTEFKNKSLTGYYDRIGPSVFLRRGSSRPCRQEVYCYKLCGRWCLGPLVGNRLTWAYSGETDEPPTGRFPWYEVTEGNHDGCKHKCNHPVSEINRQSSAKRSKSIKVYPTKNG